MNRVAREMAARVLAMPRPETGDVYEGTAGVAVFLAEMALQESGFRVRALSFAEHAAGWAAGNMEVPGFHGGGLGAWWAVRRVAALLGERALEMKLAEGGVGRGDVVAGEAGSMLALLAMGETEAARAIATRIRAAPAEAPVGRGWPAGNAEEGLAHGASGVAWALLEVDREDRTALEGFAYERAWFDRGLNNWRSPRAPHGPVALSWCHGLTGIALTRLRSFALTGRPELGAEAGIAVANLHAAAERVLAGGGEAWEDRNHSICHGIGGLVDTLLYAGDVMGDARHRETAVRLWAGCVRAGNWICGTEHGTPDAGVMLGYAGLGLLALRMEAAKPTMPVGLWPINYSTSE